jgi:fibronectin-binding autotransporter adhesin
MRVRNRHCIRPLVVFLLCFWAMLAAGANASVITWGGGTGNWNVAANWSGGALPTTGDTAVIASGTPAVNTTLSPAPDLIRVDSGGTCNFTGASITNNMTLNGGAFNMSGDSNPNMSGTITLTADSTIKNTRGNSNRTFTVSGQITEDAVPRKLTYDGAPHITGIVGDNIAVSGANNYSGGTDIYGPTVSANSSGAFGTGPVNVYSGVCRLNLSGSFTCGTITTVAGGTGAVNVYGGKNPTGVQLSLQGGSLTHNSGSGASTLNNTNSITITNTAEIKSTGAYINNPLNINTSIGGTGKAVLEDWGTPTWNGTAWNTPNVSHLTFGAAQNWSGGTEIRGLVDLNANGILPGGTVTLYGIDPAKGYSGTAEGELRLLNTVAGQNGGLNPNTNLVLIDQIFTSGPNTLVCYASLNLATNVTVNSFTLNGTVMPAGNYLTSDPAMANYLYSNSSTIVRTLTVLTPEPATLALLALAGLTIVRRRR